MLDLNRIRAISLDLDDTLWPVLPTLKAAEAAQHQFLSAHAPATAALLQDKAVAHAIRQSVRDDFVHLAHDMTHFRQQFIRRALAQAGDDAALVDPTFAQFYAARNRVTWFAEVEEALTWLSARYPLVAVSNGNARLDLVGMAPWFAASASAGEVGVAKPDARIFTAAAQTQQLPMDAFLHVGDDAALDVQGALACGMQAAWVQRAELDYHQCVDTTDQLRWNLESAAPHAMVRNLAELCQLLGR
ncbi:MAG: HAD-IA family hydrolase [Comamonas sp.]